MSQRPIVLAADGDKFGASGNVNWATALLLAGRQSGIVSLPLDPDAPPGRAGNPAGFDPDVWLALHGEQGLLAFTRSGGETAPPEDVRPRPSHRAVAERLATTARSGTELATTLEPLGHLSGSAARRYATAAADVLAPEVVPQALKVAGHTHDGWTNPRTVAVKLAAGGEQFGSCEPVWTERAVAELHRWGHNDTARQLPALIALVRSDELPEVWLRCRSVWALVVTLDSRRPGTAGGSARQRPLHAPR